MKKIGCVLSIALFGFLNFKLSMITIIVILSLILVKLQKERHALSCLMSTQTENYKSVLKHHIKTPVLAQIRALELLLKGNYGKLNKRQTEMIEMTLKSCRHSYKIIHGQLYS
ncbi:hypothetical protein IKR55_01180 [bacterium]|nr:hypothetical protein [bacterium]